MLKGRDDIMSPLLKHLVRVLSFRVSLLLLSFFKFVREYLGVLAQRRVQDINKGGTQRGGGPHCNRTLRISSQSKFCCT